MWTLILLVVGFVVVKFVIDMSKQGKQVSAEGGMRTKYRVLIDRLLSGDPRSRVIREDRTAVLLGMSSAGGSTTFDVVQTFGSVTVKWNVNSPIFGKHSTEVSFPEDMDQNEMADRLEAKVGAYQQRLFAQMG